jgi:hypothetical protein
MTTLESRLLQQLQKLPPNRVAELVDFAEFLAAREERQAAAQRLGESMAKLHALDLPPLSDDEIEEAVQESRRARRQDADDGADDQASRYTQRP